MKKTKTFYLHLLECRKKIIMFTYMLLKQVNTNICT